MSFLQPCLFSYELWKKKKKFLTGLPAATLFLPNTCYMLCPQLSTTCPFNQHFFEGLQNSNTVPGPFKGCTAQGRKHIARHEDVIDSISEGLLLCFLSQRLHLNNPFLRLLTSHTSRPLTILSSTVSLQQLSSRDPMSISYPFTTLNGSLLSSGRKRPLYLKLFQSPVLSFQLILLINSPSFSHPKFIAEVLFLTKCSASSRALNFCCS